jgi:cell division initiation protein
MSERLTAMDIEKQEFKRSLRGFDPDDVKLFLRSVAEEVQRLNLDNADLREEQGRLKSEVEKYRTREKTLQDTLVAAQKMSDELATKSKAEADLLVREARIKAERLLQQSQDQLSRLEDEVSQARLEADAFERRLRGAIEQHLELLDLRKAKRGDIGGLHVLRRATGSESG